MRNVIHSIKTTLAKIVTLAKISPDMFCTLLVFFIHSFTSLDLFLRLHELFEYK